jgi:hypothetical protein
VTGILEAEILSRFEINRYSPMMRYQTDFAVTPILVFVLNSFLNTTPRMDGVCRGISLALLNM